MAPFKVHFVVNCSSSIADEVSPGQTGREKIKEARKAKNMGYKVTHLENNLDAWQHIHPRRKSPNSEPTTFGTVRLNHVWGKNHRRM